MRTFRLAFLGGCLTHQPDIPFARLFHRELARRLERRVGLRLQVVVPRNFELDHDHRLAGLLRTQRLDGVLIHLSNFAFTPKVNLFVKWIDATEVRYFLHPCLLQRRRRSWTQLERDGFRGCVPLWNRRRPQPGPAAPPPDPEGEVVPEIGAARLLGVRWRDLNLMAGWGLGLGTWAIGEECSLLSRVHDLCRQEGLPLMVMGPGNRIGEPWMNRCSYALDRALDRCVGRLSQARYVPLLRADRHHSWLGWMPPGLHGPDGLHFNSRGHAHLADCLEQALVPWLGTWPAQAAS